jgi:hypothetical protein
MTNFLLTFIFIFCLILILKFAFSFAITLLSTTPKKYEFEKYEQLYYGISISYLLTYLIVL